MINEEKSTPLTTSTKTEIDLEKTETVENEAVSPASETHTTATTHTVPSNPAKSSMSPLVVLLAGILIGGAALYGVNMYYPEMIGGKPAVTATPSPSSTPVASSTPSSDSNNMNPLSGLFGGTPEAPGDTTRLSTANTPSSSEDIPTSMDSSSETYSSALYGFSFQYPSTWEVESRETNKVKLVSGSNSITVSVVPDPDKEMTLTEVVEAVKDAVLKQNSRINMSATENGRFDINSGEEIQAQYFIAGNPDGADRNAITMIIQSPNKELYLSWTASATKASTDAQIESLRDMMMTLKFE